MANTINTPNNRSNTARDGKSSMYDRSLTSYMKSRSPYNYNVLDTDESKNTKYKYFQNVGMRRPEAIAKNSIALNNDFNNTAYSSIEQDKSFGEVMYAAASEDKPGRMRDYRTMAAFSEINDALNEIADESINSDEDDNIVLLKFKHAELDSDKKKEVQEEFNRYIEYYNLHDNGWKYFKTFLVEGELFFEQIIHKDFINEGVLGVVNIPSEMIDPVYSNIQNMLVKGFLYQKPIFDKNDPKKIEKYEPIPFEENQVVYINNSEYNETKEFIVPYIENARRAYRQLSMIEDSIVIHRMVHAPLRFVFNVDVGRLPVPQAEAYLRKLQSQYWSTKTFDSDQGDIVKKYSPQSTLDSYWFAKRQGQEATSVQEIGGACLAMDTKVPLLDGRTLTIREITDEYNSGNKLWVYSCDPTTGEIVPGLISWAGVTQKSAKVMKMTLDNGKEITCTLDHKFPIYEKGFMEAQDLNIGDSLIPFNTKEEKLGNGAYQQIYQNNTKKWEYTHRMVGNYFKSMGLHEEFIHDERHVNDRKTVIHHKDFNRYNNSPENLVFMYFIDHIKYHSTFQPPLGAGGKALKAKLDDMKINNPDAYQKYHEQRVETTTNSWKSKTESERVEWVNNIGIGIANYMSNLSIEEKEKRTINAIKNAKLATQGFLNKFYNDPEFRARHSANAKKHINNYYDNLTEEEWAELSKVKTSKILANDNYWNGIEENAINQTLAFDQKILKAVIDLVKGTTTNQMNKENIINNLNNNSELLEHFLKLNDGKNIKNWSGDKFSATHLSWLVKSFGYDTWMKFRKEHELYNHRIEKIEYLDSPIEVGTLTIDNDEQFHNHHTFALDCGVFTKNSNLGSMDDLMFFIKKLYRSLGVPTSRLDPEDAFRDGTDILREELKFATMIIRQQKKFGAGIKRGFITHLKLRKMFEDYDLNEQHLNIIFNPPSNFHDLRNNQKMELKINSFNNLVSTQKVSTTLALKKVMGWDDQMILANNEFMRVDAGLAWEIAQITSLGPNFKQQLLDQANAGAPPEGGMGAPPDMGGGGGPSIPPTMGGPVGGEAPPNAGIPPEAPAVPEEPPA